MKKFFNKLETNANASSIGSQSLNAGIVNNDSNQIKEFIGKSFAVGRYNVVVEDVIAEGEQCEITICDWINIMEFFFETSDFNPDDLSNPLSNSQVASPLFSSSNVQRITRSMP